MAYALTTYGSLCSTDVFSINTVAADADDFGENYATESSAEEGCRDMRFYPKAPTAEVLAKYYIDELEYWSIANDLADKLSFGDCGWCV